MSTEDPAPDAESIDTTTNVPTATAEADAPEPELEAEQSKPRAPPIADDPPRGASRSLGGRCPKCNGPMHSRLRASYSDEGHRTMGMIKLTGVCDECNLFLEGSTPAVRLFERDI